MAFYPIKYNLLIYGMNPALLSVLHDVNELEEEIDDNEIPIHKEL